MATKIIKNYLTKNTCYTSARYRDVRGLMLHSIGCPQPRLNNTPFLMGHSREILDHLLQLDSFHDSSRLQNCNIICHGFDLHVVRASWA